MKRSWTIYAILCLGIIFYSLQALKSRALRADTERARSNLAALKGELTKASEANQFEVRKISDREKQLRSIEDELAFENQVSVSALNAIWSEPPQQLPQWNLQSPFIWIDKEILLKLPLPTIGKEGELTKEIAEILGVNEAQRSRLNRQLSEIVSENRALGRSAEEVSNEDFPAAGGSDGARITVKIEKPKEAMEELKSRYESALRDELGEDRKTVICSSILTDNWLRTEFGIKPEFISVIRDPNGTFTIGYKERRRSYGGLPKLEGYIPEYLLPFFESIRNKTE